MLIENIVVGKNHKMIINALTVPRVFAIQDWVQYAG